LSASGVFSRKPTGRSPSSGRSSSRLDESVEQEDEAAVGENPPDVELVRVSMRYDRSDDEARGEERVLEQRPVQRPLMPLRVKRGRSPLCRHRRRACVEAR
jgi:hypothetical protein